jgi:hypothetical protein
MSNELYKGISNVVHISTNVQEGCKHCTFGIGGESIAESINHYIQQHGYKLLHVGSESLPFTGESFTATVAVLGK